ncbi:Glucose-induced degradation protein 8 [Balamuthia mandrillaris]
MSSTTRHRGYGSSGLLASLTGGGASSSASNRQKQPFSLHEWNAKLKAIHVSKAEMNKLVMDYLVVEGYKDVAEKFQKESGTKPAMPLESITERMAIRADLLQGEVAAAVDKVNQIDPELLDNNPQLSFHIKQQQLIELIRSGGTEDALQFAQEHLAPCGEHNEQLLEELERTMALLLFADAASSSSSAPPNYANLLDMAQRQKTAGELNAAILSSLHQNHDPKLLTLLKMLLWSQGQLADRLPCTIMLNETNGATLSQVGDSCSSSASSSAPSTPPQ